MISRRQKIEFKRNGFIVLRGVLDEEIVREMRAVYERDPLPETMEELQEIKRDPQNANFDYRRRLAKIMYDRTLIVSPPTTEPFETINDRISEYAAELAGEGIGTTLRTTQFVHRLPGDGFLTSPSAKQPSDLTRQPHIDGIRNTEGQGLYPIGAAIYVDRVQPRGGGFTVWPGSHWLVADFLREHDPEEATDGVPAPTEDGWDDEERIRDRFDPFEISGDAGTVILWHGHIVHSGGVNLEPGMIRKELISRFYFPDKLKHEDRLVDPFAGWPIADLPPVLSRDSRDDRT